MIQNSFFVALTYFFAMNWIFFLKMKIIQATQITPYEVNTFWNYKQTEEPTALYINYFLTNLMFFFFALFCLRMNTLTAHCSFFTLTNFSLYNIYLWTLLNILFFWTLKHLNYDMQNMFKLDYLFSLMNIFFFLFTYGM